MNLFDEVIKKGISMWVNINPFDRKNSGDAIVAFKPPC